MKHLYRFLTGFATVWIIGGPTVFLFNEGHWPLPGLGFLWFTSCVVGICLVGCSSIHDGDMP